MARAVGTADVSMAAGLRLRLQEGTAGWAQRAPAPSDVSLGGVAGGLGAGAIHSP